MPEERRLEEIIARYNLPDGVEWAESDEPCFTCGNPLGILTDDAQYYGERCRPCGHEYIDDTLA